MKKQKQQTNPLVEANKASAIETEELYKSGKYKELIDSMRTFFVAMTLSEGDKVENPSRTKFSVYNGDVVKSIIDQRGKENVGVLNFASPVMPAGYWRKGSPAQEQTLCRASFLWASLESPTIMKRFYKPNEDAETNGLYDNRGVYTKAVPFIKVGKGELVDPVTVNVLTLAAPNASASSFEKDSPEIEAALRERITQALRVFKEMGDRTLILGAFGCGAFGNDPYLVARIFKEALREDEFRGAFDEIIFAIYGKGPNLNAFNQFF